MASELRLTFSTSAKRSRKSISLAKKMEVISRFEIGERQTAIGRDLKYSTSTIRTIIANKEKIKSSALSNYDLTVKKLTRSRSSILEKMEKHLVQWINDQNEQNIPINQAIISQKAKDIYDFLKEKEGSESNNETFKASSGWFHRFRKRCNLHNRTGNIIAEDSENEEENTENKTTSENFPDYLKNIISTDTLVPELVFNVAETDLYWKRLPTQAYIPENNNGEIDISKDKFTLLLGINAVGDIKLKPTLIYHTDTPKEMKGYLKSFLPVIWESNIHLQITVEIFNNWLYNHFCPTVKKYCDRHRLEPKALIILGNTLSYLQNRIDLHTPFPVQVIYIPEETTTILQPLHDEVMLILKAFYLKQTLFQMNDAIKLQNKIITNFWSSYNIMNAIDNISEAWKNISRTYLNRTWKYLWTEIVDFTSFTDLNLSDIGKDIVKIGQEIGFNKLDEQSIEVFLYTEEDKLKREEIITLIEVNQDGGDTEETSSDNFLTQDFLSDRLNNILSELDMLSENDPNWERICNVKRTVINSLKCYKGLLHRESRDDNQVQPNVVNDFCSVLIKNEVKSDLESSEGEDYYD